MGKPQNSPEERINQDAEQGQTARYKSLTIRVPSDTDTLELEGNLFPAWPLILLRSCVDRQRMLEADRVPQDSPLACARCKRYLANHCSLCLEQVCQWCHRPDVDHHGGKVRPQGIGSRTYIMTDPESGAMIPHETPGEDADDSYHIHEPLVGPCLTCGYDGHVYRLMYRDPASGPWWKKGVAYEAICYACGAGGGNRESVHHVVPEPLDEGRGRLVVFRDLDEDRTSVYREFTSGKWLLERDDFPNRAAADAYVEHEQQMDAACDKIHEDYQALVKQWIVDKAEETCLEPKLVREWIEGLYLD